MSILSGGFADTHDNLKNYDQKANAKDAGPYIGVVKNTIDPLKTELEAGDGAEITFNIANASSLGFKRSSASFSDVYTEMSNVRNADRVGNGVRQEAPRRNHSQGSLILTGNALDLGMNGQGMFILNTLEKLGELSYTRNGAINIREDGRLVSSDGLSYLDIESQEINLPFQIPLLREINLPIPLA